MRTNSIESVWAVLKRSIHGTWHHVSPKHLARYVNEVTLRLNEGNCEIDTIDRMKSFVEGIHTASAYATMSAERTIGGRVAGSVIRLA